MSHIMIFGASGFVARSFIPFLAKEGRKKFCLIDRNPLPQSLLEERGKEGQRPFSAQERI